MKLLCIIQSLLTGIFLSACGTSPRAETRHPDGSVTSVPVAKPEDVLHAETCKATLNSQF